MTTIVTRAGKGSPLTHTEVDTNFTNLNTNKLEAGAIALGSAATPSISFTGDLNTGIYSPDADQVAVATNGTEKLIVLSNGNVGIGNSSPNYTLDVTGTHRNSGIYFNQNDTPQGTAGTISRHSVVGLITRGITGSAFDWSVYSASGNALIVNITGTNTINFTGGAVGIGTTGPGGTLDIKAAAATHPLIVQGPSSEFARIDSSGRLLVGTVNDSPAFNNVVGIALDGLNGLIASCRDGNSTATFGRKTNDGDIVEFYQDGTREGSISVSGTTVSYNGAHLSRWSQLPSGADRIEILRGSVLSNLDEMCEWGEEDNEQLNRMKVSDVEGDKNVSGVFQCWDDDDDTYTNDFYCAMTGDFIIRIAEGITIERGDLLMSAGDGTAKPQDDDIIRSKTVAKVTSTNVTCTYDDGSYCVPCVLMAC